MRTLTTNSLKVTIRLAADDEEFREAFSLRHRTFIGEGILHHDSADELLFDVFDALPTSHVLVAVVDSAVVGTVRVTVPSDHRMPSDQYGVPDDAFPGGARVGSGSMLCVAPEFRRTTVARSLVKEGMNFQRSNGADHVVAPVRPQAVPLFRRLGWYQIGPDYNHPVELVPIVPMAVTLAGESTATEPDRSSTTPGDRAGDEAHRPECSSSPPVPDPAMTRTHGG